MSENAPLLLYQTEDRKTRILVQLEGETVWLSQKAMAELFQTTKQNVSLHIQNTFEEGELDPAATVKEYLTVQAEGERQVNRKVEHYNLDVIISVGYRVRSHRGTQFRVWATQRLREYLVKGFALDDERLKGKPGVTDYFDELLERIRDIRASERRFYQKVCEIYALSLDYDPLLPMTQEFYATVQNKFHYAITGKTAAEIIATRADSAKPNMGLTSWKGRKVRREDVVVAKNYLEVDEIRQLNQLVDQYLSFAESQAERRIPMYMADWLRKLNGFLLLNDRDILKDAGRISAEAAKDKALRHYDSFDAGRRKAEALEDTDFDKAVKHIKEVRTPQEAPPKKPAKKTAKGKKKPPTD